MKWFVVLVALVLSSRAREVSAASLGTRASSEPAAPSLEVFRHEEGIALIELEHLALGAVREHLVAVRAEEPGSPSRHAEGR